MNNIQDIRIFSESLNAPDYTSAKNFGEALLVSEQLTNRTGCQWYVVDGPKNWKTGKLSCYLIKKEQSNDK